MTLYQTIKNRGYVTLDELQQIGKEMGYRVSNTDRRLRELVKFGNIRAIRNLKRFIVGYEPTLPQNRSINQSVAYGEAFNMDQPINLNEIAKRIKFGDVDSLELLNRIKKENRQDRKEYLIKMLKARIENE